MPGGKATTTRIALPLAGQSWALGGAGQRGQDQAQATGGWGGGRHAGVLEQGRRRRFRERHRIIRRAPRHEHRLAVRRRRHELLDRLQARPARGVCRLHGARPRGLRPVQAADMSPATRIPTASCARSRNAGSPGRPLLGRRRSRCSRGSRHAMSMSRPCNRRCWRRGCICGRPSRRQRWHRLRWPIPCPHWRQQMAEHLQPAAVRSSDTQLPSDPVARPAAVVT